ncbi:MAG: hypothetical protein CSA61_00890 [Neptuniibacter caesariensis]|uniref:Nitroreductase n=1 Tax=Neptuniibacter caesariensis TaxID=207954 RepID=A0A2G6JBD4_NEPCE|nr:MAG: hypothetical protein CSA61_00890 [Neptuniibacter caesariensis]
MASLFSFLAQAFQAAPSADNSQPYMGEWHGKTLCIHYDHKRVADTTFPADSPATLLSLGGIIENMAQLCKSAGVEVDVHLQNLEQSNPSAILSIPGDLSLPPKCGNLAIFARHTNRFAYKKTPLPADLLAALSQLAYNTTRVSLFADKSGKTDICKLVKSASEIRFQTKELLEWLGKSLRFNRTEAGQGDGLDIKTIDLPPGGSLMIRLISHWKWMRILNAVGAYKLFSAIDASPVRVAPGVIAITGKCGPAGAIAAGRTLVRVWSELNARGIAAHPYYVIADQLVRLQDNAVPAGLVDQAKTLAQGSRKVFSLEEDETLYMLLRIGYPAKTAPRSKRLPSRINFHDLTH